MQSRGFRLIASADSTILSVGIPHYDRHGKLLSEYFVSDADWGTPLYSTVTVVPHTSAPEMKTTASIDISLTLGWKDSPWPWEISARRDEVKKLTRDFGKWIDDGMIVKLNEEAEDAQGS